MDINAFQKKIGYLLIDTFALNTDEQFKTKLKELEDANMDSLIIDVRSNTGGHLSTVTNIISEFLDKSKTIYQTDTKGKIEKIKSKGDKTKNYKIVLLGDGASASASEVLIAALKESYGATFVGTTTFGKGTVQEMHSIEATGENYKITTKKWLTPNGNWINEKGINPDYEVFLDGSYFENPTKENDSQIQKAWDEAILLKEEKDYMVLGNDKTLVIESDGSSWKTKEPAIMYFFKNEWFNIIAQLKKDGIYYYCNIATPYIIEEDTIKYIDYDLDLRIFPSGQYKILDTLEYNYHKKLMNYSKELDIIINTSLKELIEKYNNKFFPFSKTQNEAYKQQYFNIKCKKV